MPGEGERRKGEKKRKGKEMKRIKEGDMERKEGVRGER